MKVLYLQPDPSIDSSDKHGPYSQDVCLHSISVFELQEEQRYLPLSTKSSFTLHKKLLFPLATFRNG
jgi:hypothetical protein